MQPTAEGYKVRVVLENTNPAALLEDGGVGDFQRSYGGARRRGTVPPAPIWEFAVA